jgi:uncharacterized phage-associated protein
LVRVGPTKILLQKQSQKISYLTNLIYCERHDGVILLKSGLVSQILEAVAAQPVVSVCIKETGSRDTITFVLPVQTGPWVNRGTIHCWIQTFLSFFYSIAYFRYGTYIHCASETTRARCVLLSLEKRLIIER